MKPSGCDTKVSGPKTPEKPKVLAPGMYAISSKYIPPPKRADWIPPTPRKKHVTFQEPTRASTRHTKQTAVNNHKKPNVNVIVSTGMKTCAGVSKFQSSKMLITRSLEFCLIRICLVINVPSMNTMHAKKPQVARPKTTPKYIRKTDIIGCSQNCSSVEAHWRNQFLLCDIYGPKKSLTPIAKPLELSNVVLVLVPLLLSSLGCSRHMTGDRSKLINYVEKFVGTVRFGNDQFATIVGYGDYKMGDTIISRVYYVEGLSHNLFSVGQFCDGGLEVAFRQHTCHIRNMDKVDLLQGSRTTNLYSISLNDMLSASPVCLLTKASSTKSWLWHRRLNHLNFGTLNELTRNDLKASHPLQTCDSNKEFSSLLHMDLCGPMRTESINKKKYVLFLKNTQLALNATVRTVRTDNGTEFDNKTLTDLFESVGITHQTSVPRAEAVATACYTLNRSLIHTLYGKTYYELLKGKKPDLVSNLVASTHPQDGVIGFTIRKLVNPGNHLVTYWLTLSGVWLAVQHSAGPNLMLYTSGRLFDLVHDPNTKCP
ncbi:retrovirus-related pol polyprotein from transposon TNT 1-94 [Tanacetum coccineum]